MVRRKNKQKKLNQYYFHLVSDATGTTLLGLSRACTAQFEGMEAIQKFWPLVRTQRQLDRVIRKITKYPGPVIFTLVDKKMRHRLQERCDELGLPCVSVLDPIIRGLSTHLGVRAKNVPGLQHTMNDSYFKRIAAIDFAIRFDDGKCLKGLGEADVILVGVSRTSKTPTSVFLSRCGIKAANIPLVPGVDIPPEDFAFEGPLYIGLTAAHDRLVQIRRNRLRADKEAKGLFEENTYLDEQGIKDEIRDARRLFSDHGWPVIDVTKRSIEETSAEIMTLLQTYKEEQNDYSE